MAQSPQVVAALHAVAQAAEFVAVSVTKVADRYRVYVDRCRRDKEASLATAQVALFHAKTLPFLPDNDSL